MEALSNHYSLFILFTLDIYAQFIYAHKSRILYYSAVNWTIELRENPPANLQDPPPRS